MQSLVVLVFATLLSLVCAQPFTILTNGTATRFIALPSDDFVVVERRSFNAGIFVPKNAIEVTYNVNSIAYNSSFSACGDPEIRISGGGRGVGCFEAGGDYEGNFIVPCLDYDNEFPTSGSPFPFNGDEVSGTVSDFKLGTWWIFSTQSDTSDGDDGIPCIYDVSVTITTCPTGQVSVWTDSVTFVCVTPITAIGVNQQYPS